MSHPPLHILRRQQLRQRIGFSLAHIYAMMDPKSPSFDPSFPRPIRLGVSAVGWLEHEVQAWLEARVSATRIRQDELNDQTDRRSEIIKNFASDKKCNVDAR